MERTQILHAAVVANLIRMTIVASVNEKEHKITKEAKQHKGPVSMGVTDLQGNFTIIGGFIYILLISVTMKQN